MGEAWDALSALGALTVAWVALRVMWKVGRNVYVFLLPSVRRDACWLRSHGAWAVVTGATDGIGKAYAHALARRGLNMVLISRNLDKLEQEAKEIERLHGTLTRVIQVDFTGGLEIYEAIEEGLKGLEIGILVNNVGMPFGNKLGKMLNSENLAKRLSNIINCNMMSMAQMTRIILPQMVSRHRGIIINISSAVEKRPTPFLAVYSATKAFVQSFSRAVGAEYSPEGVIVQEGALDAIALPPISFLPSAVASRPRMDGRARRGGAAQTERTSRRSEAARTWDPEPGGPGPATLSQGPRDSLQSEGPGLLAPPAALSARRSWPPAWS
ncbi:very-long-chain 3-oxoacyl-CoA reductase-B-like [Rhynchocyon petersi]